MIPFQGGRAARTVLQRLFLLLLIPAAYLWAQLPDSTLAVQKPDGKAFWWRAADAPKEWTAALPIVTKAIQWHGCRPGLEHGRLDLWGEHVGWHVAVILARLDPTRFNLLLQLDVIDARPAWSIDSIPADAALAVNAGQFELDRPWGWIVNDGSERQPPRPGPLSSALVVDREGRVSIIDAEDIGGARNRGDIMQAFQSYPAILVGKGRVPDPLHAPGRGVDLDHRDSRLALGILSDGRLLIALTRFAGMGSVLSQLPFGPTTAEMAAIMGALGCQRAMLLDGGLSGQLMLKDDRQKKNRYPGLRAVPLGLIAIPK
jgi:hypothetical protein